MQQPDTQEPANAGIFSGLTGSIVRAMVFYYGFQYLFGPKPPAAPISDSPDSIKQINAFNPKWNLGIKTDLYAYISQDAVLTNFDTGLIWEERGIEYGNWNDVRSKSLKIPCSTHVQNNGSLYAHFYLTWQGIKPSDFNDEKTLYHRKLLTRFMPKKKAKKLKNLLKQEQEEQEIAIEPTDTPIVSYWWQNVTLNLVTTQDPIPTVGNPKALDKIRLTSDGAQYYPIFYTNDFWMLHENLMPINDTVKYLNMSLTYYPLSFWKYSMYIQFDESFKTQTEKLGSDQAEIDQMKSMFLDTNPILLAITIAVSILHSIFDFLAFKNDVEFWKNRKNMEGLSFRTIILNVIQQLIIFLYLWDNETSKMILVSNGIGLLIEIWKINKTVIIKPKQSFPFVQFIDRVEPSKLTKKTRKYDEMAFNYLTIVLVPLLMGYTIYSLYYESHKSWYSFVIGTLVGFVYMFGFISMTPQLFINYKLKSVAHMPWKTFMYKALNTFIDDLFAFVIKMPMLHRLACLRDDLIFVVYLYQRWIYPEDKRRRNEFGQVGEETHSDNDEEDEEEESTESKKEK